MDASELTLPSPQKTQQTLLRTLTIAAILLTLLKIDSLLTFWQQSRHWFLTVQPGNLPHLISPENSWASSTQKNWQDFISQASKRMTLASRLLVEGESVLVVQKTCEVKKTTPEKTQCAAVATTKPAKPAPIKTESSQSSLARSSETDVSAHSISSVSIAEENSLSEQSSSTSNQSSTTSKQISNTSNATSANLKTVNQEKTNSEIISHQNLESTDITPIDLTATDLTPVDVAMKNHQAIPTGQGERFLLIGDSMMQGVAPHLTSVLQRKYAIDAIDMGTKSTGLTYPSFFDWPAHVDDAFNQQHYFALVVLLGANDTWDMIEANHYVKFASPSWREKYADYVQHILKTAQKNNTKVIWLSAPPMGREDLADRIPVLNEIIETEIQKFPLTARFVSTASVLTSDGKTYTKFIDVPDRGNVMVRIDDGVHFTSYGENLLARLVLNQFKLTPIEKQSSGNH